MKKLFRISKDKLVFGICAGIAESFAMDPTLVRLISVFACAFTGFFPLIITYIVGYFIIPEKETQEIVKENTDGI